MNEVPHRIGNGEDHNDGSQRRHVTMVLTEDRTVRQTVDRGSSPAATLPAMSYEFRLPDIGEGLTEAEIVVWHGAVGDEVDVDQLIVDVETAKTVVEIPSPQAGSIVSVAGAPGSIVEVGSVLFTISSDDVPTSVAPLPVAEPTPEPTPATTDPRAAPQPAARYAGESAPAVPPGLAPPGAGHELVPDTVLLLVIYPN